MLTINNLDKFYGRFHAVDHLNLQVEKGEIFGFIGPNGAGKTTTMRIICGLLKANSGEVYVDGIDAVHDTNNIRKKVGYVPDFFGVYDNLKVTEYMNFFGSMYGYDEKDIKDNVAGLLELVNLSDKADDMVDGLSRGMKQRLCVARALIHDPALLVLDEPASGLDPRARFELKEILKNLSEMGKTIMISSHILPELSEMCTSVGIMNKGKLVLSGSVDEIIASSRRNAPLHLQFLDKNSVNMNIIRENPLVAGISELEDGVDINFDGNDSDMADFVGYLFSKGIKLTSFMREETSLESMFLEVTDADYSAEEGGKKND